VDEHQQFVLFAREHRQALMRPPTNRNGP